MPGPLRNVLHLHRWGSIFVCPFVLSGDGPDVFVAQGSTVRQLAKRTDMGVSPSFATIWQETGLP